MGGGGGVDVHMETLKKNMQKTKITLTLLKNTSPLDDASSDMHVQIKSYICNQNRAAYLPSQIIIILSIKILQISRNFKKKLQVCLFGNFETIPDKVKFRCFQIA